MRFIVVEVGKSDSPSAMPVQLPKSALETENDRVRVYRIKLASGESLTAHSHASGWVEVTVAGGKGPGASVWRDAATSSSLSATGAPLEIVEIEPK
jgi:hypothetical protein